MPKIGYFDGVHPGNNCCSLFLEHLKTRPQKTAIQWVSPDAFAQWKSAPEGPLNHTKFNFGELFAMATRTAWGLQKLGIGKGDCVILFVPMTPYLYSTMFGLQLIGAIPVFLDTWARRQQLGLVAQIVKAKAMISVEKAFELCDGEPQVDAIPIKICLGPATRQYTARVEEFLIQTESVPGPTPVEREHTALITFTTGSSGVPKGANRTHRFLAAQHYALDKCVPYTDADNDLPVFPVFSLNNLAAGVTTILPAIDVANPSEMDAQILVRQILDCNLTCMTLNPSLLSGISRYCAAKGIKLEKLRRVFAGGAAVSRDAVLEFVAIAPNCDLQVAYGSTEVEPITHIGSQQILATRSVTETDPELVDEGVVVGHFADGLEYKFLRITKDPIAIKSAADWKAWELPQGETGELIVAGEHVCRDYFNDTEAFKRAKILDERGVVWHRTGDVGRLDAHGNVWLVGRVHNTITRGGKYFFPVQAEIVLKRMPFVKLAAYLGIADKQLGEKCYCVVTPKDAADLANTSRQEQWKREIERIMAKNGIPVDGIVFRSDVPLDPRHRSKVEYDVLRKALLDEGLV